MLDLVTTANSRVRSHPTAWVNQSINQSINHWESSIYYQCNWRSYSTHGPRGPRTYDDGPRGVELPSFLLKDSDVAAWLPAHAVPIKALLEY